MATFSVRLSEAEHEALAAMSLLTGRPAADIVREAIGRALREFDADAGAGQVRVLERARQTLKAFAGERAGE